MNLFGLYFWPFVQLFGLVSMADVLIKLGSLLVKTLSKPIAKGLKGRLTNHPVMTERCIKVGQMSHQFWSWITIRASGHVGLRVKALDDATALNTGAETISEIFIFSVAGICIVSEMARSDWVKTRDAEAKKRKEKEKEKELSDALNGIRMKLDEIEAAQAKLSERAIQLEKKRNEPESRPAYSPWAWLGLLRK